MIMKQLIPKLIEYSIPAIIAIFSAYMTIQVKTAVLEATVKELNIKVAQLEQSKVDRTYFDFVIKRLDKIDEKLDYLMTQRQKGAN